MTDRTAWVLIETAGGPENQYHLYHGVEGAGFQFRGALTLTPAEADDLLDLLDERERGPEAEKEEDEKEGQLA